MRILYLANYQGLEASRRRKFVRNRALGATTKVEALARILARSGHDVTLLSPAIRAERTGYCFEAMQETLAGVGPGSCKIRYLAAWDLPVINKVVGYLGTISWLARHPSWDLALIYNLGALELRAAKHFVSQGTPVVFEYEDDAAATLERGRGSNPGGLRLIARARSLAKGAITVNQELRAQLGVTNSIVVEGLVSDHLFEYDQRTYCHGEEPLQILYSGSLAPQKGVLLLLEAASMLDFSWRLTITGSGPLEAPVAALAKQDSRIRFLGELNRSDLEQQYAAAHLCVNPHRSVSGQAGTLFPFKIVEYLSAGCRVVSSPLGNMERRLADSIKFYSDDSAPAMARAISDVALHFAEWGEPLKHARAYAAAQLSWSSVSERLNALIERSRR